MHDKILHDIAAPLLVGAVGGFIRILMVGSGKSKVQLVRSFIVSVLLGCLTGIIVTDLGYSPVIQSTAISLVSILGGDFFEGLLKLAAEWKKDPKSIINLFRGKD